MNHLRMRIQSIAIVATVVAACALVAVCIVTIRLELPPVAVVVEFAVDPSQNGADAIAALERVSNRDASAVRKACADIVASDSYGHDLRKWCLRYLVRTGIPTEVDLADLASESWFDSHWLNPRRCAGIGSLQNEYSEGPRTNLYAALDCTITGADIVITFSVHNTTRKEYTEFVRSLQAGRRPDTRLRASRFSFYPMVRTSKRVQK